MRLPTWAETKALFSALKRPWVWEAVALLIVAVVLVSRMSGTQNPPQDDEFTLVYDAQRVVAGQVPYRDYFEFIPPGTFWLLALSQSVLRHVGPVGAARVLAALVAFMTCALWARYLRRAGYARSWALLLASVFPLDIYFFWSNPSHHWFALLFFSLSFEGWDFGHAHFRQKWGAAFAGAAAALSSLFLQTTPVGMVLLWSGALWGQKDGRKGDLVRACLGFGLVWLPVVSYLALRGALLPCFKDIVLWTGANYHAADNFNAVAPLADLSWRFGYLCRSPRPVMAALVMGLFAGLLALGGGALLVSFGTAAKAIAKPKAAGGLALGAAMLTFFEALVFIRSRPDWPHFIFALAPTGLAWLAVLGTKQDFSWLRRSVFGVAAVMTGLGLCFYAGTVRILNVGPEAILGADHDARDSYLNRFLNAQPWLLPGDTIAVFPTGGAAYLYVRPAAVGYTRFQPLKDGYNSPLDHEIVARQIEERKPRCIVLQDGLEAAFLDPASPVAVVIGQEYRRLVRVGRTMIYRRVKEELCGAKGDHQQKGKGAPFRGPSTVQSRAKFTGTSPVYLRA